MELQSGTKMWHLQLNPLGAKGVKLKCMLF